MNRFKINIVISLNSNKSITYTIDKLHRQKLHNSGLEKDKNQWIIFDFLTNKLSKVPFIINFNEKPFYACFAQIAHCGVKIKT